MKQTAKDAMVNVRMPKQLLRALERRAVDAAKKAGVQHVSVGEVIRSILERDLAR